MSTLDETNPGFVNVADQAYPAVPGTSQSLPVPQEAFASFFVPPPLPTLAAGSPTPVNAFVANANLRPASFSIGLPIPTPPDVIIANQDLIKFQPADWVVTESGSFQTNNSQGDQVGFHILSVVVINAGLPTQAYQIFLQNPVNLYAFGLDLTDMLVSFPSAAPVSAPENVPQRPIVSYNTNWILVNGFDSAGNLLNIPGFGNAIFIGILRDGPDVIYQTNLPEIDVFVRQSPLPPPAPLGVVGNFQGTFAARSEVRIPFIGSGVNVPPLIGTFEVENQSLVGQGLPANVFI